MMDRGHGVPAGLRESTRASLDESERLARDWHGAAGGRLGYAWAPRFILSCSEELVRGAVERAAERGQLVHTHAAEHPAEREAVRARARATTTWRSCGAGEWPDRAPSSRTACSSSDDEARAMAREGTRVVHCPSANLKLGSGIARVAELDALGVQLALGADGAPCNNNLDAWTELRHAALLAKVRTGVTALPARRALRLATIDGARALGLDATSSVPSSRGKRADLAVVRLDGPHVEPGGDVFSRLVYACGARDVQARPGRRRRVVGPRPRAPALDVERVKARRASRRESSSPGAGL